MSDADKNKDNDIVRRELETVRLPITIHKSTTRKNYENRWYIMEPGEVIPFAMCRSERVAEFTKTAIESYVESLKFLRGFGGGLPKELQEDEGDDSNDSRSK